MPSTKELQRQTRVATEKARNLADSPDFETDSAVQRSFDRQLAEAKRLRAQADESELGDARSALGSVIFGNGNTTPTVMDPQLRDFFAPPELDGPQKRRVILPMQKRADEEWFIDTAKTVKAGYFVGSEIGDKILWHENATSGVLAAGPTRVVTQHGRTIQYPTLVTDAAAVQRAERVASTLTEPVFGTVSLEAYSQAGHMVLTQELMRDAEVNVWDAVLNVAGRALATKVGTCVAVGTGSDEPHGLNVAASSGLTTALATSFTADELINLYLSVLPGSRAKGSWIFGSTAFGILLRLKDADGNYLLRTLENGSFSLMGKSCLEDAAYPATTAGLCPVTFGDVSAYLFRDAGLMVERDDSTFFVNWETVVRFQHVIDGELGDTGAVKKMTMHA